MFTPAGKQRRFLLFSLLAALLASGCATNPVTGRSELTLVSEQEEIGIGAKNYRPGQQASGGRYLLDPGLSAYVNEVGQKLTRVSERPQLPYEFVVLNDSVPNAWALPGGKIAVNRGLLYELRSEAELAAVLGHEIVHAAARHGASAMETNLVLQTGAAVIGAAAAEERQGELIGMAANVGAGLLGLKYGRDHELEADRYGMIYMARAGYAPEAAVALQETFVRLAGKRDANWLAGLLSSHPPSQERVDENRKLAATLPAGLKTGEQEYRSHVASLLKARPAYADYDAGRKILKENPQQALKLANRAIAAEPREALFYGLRGDARAGMQEWREAEADYTEAIRRDGEYYAHYLQRGLARQKLGQAVEAKADLERSVALLPTAPAHHALGRMASAEGKNDLAIRHFRAAAQADGEIGRESLQLLARLELPREPGKYFSLSRSVDGNGRLVLAVRNNSPVAVRDVVVSARLAENGWTTRWQEQYRLRGTLRPGAVERITLPLRPADLQSGSRRFEAAVESAQAAD
jgi:predicted Zn-dependent protease